VESTVVTNSFKKKADWNLHRF